MRKKLFAKIDIVLSDGVFLKRGNTYEVDISQKDYDFVAPYITDMTQPEEQEVIKPKPKKSTKKVEEKNELD